MTAAASGSGKGRPPIAGHRLGSDAPGLLTRLRRDTLQALPAGPLFRPTLIRRGPAHLQPRIAQRWPGVAKAGPPVAPGGEGPPREALPPPAPRRSPPPPARK